MHPDNPNNMHPFLSLIGKEAVDSWYSEIKDYKFAQPGFGSNTGKPACAPHFTLVSSTVQII